MRLQLNLFGLLLFCLAILASKPVAAQSFEGEKSDWHGFECYDFKVGDRPCKLAVPKEPAEGKPWVWRAVFWGHEPQTEIALLKLGYHIGFVECTDLLGSPEMIAQRDAFYKEMTERYGLSKRPVLLGMSRGGLCSLNWAVANPDKVRCLYIDAPVCDFKSWPGGRGKSPGSEGDWAQLLKVYDFTEAEALAYKGNPIDAMQPLAEKKVPILLIYGDADEVVPFDENGEILIKRYREQGGPIEVIRKPGIGHHPHSLKDPTPIVEFIEKAK